MMHSFKENLVASCEACHIEDAYWLTDKIDFLLRLSHYDRVQAIIATASVEELRQLLGNGQTDTLVLGPCPDYVESILPYLQAAFPRIVLLDNLKQGRVWQGISILPADELPELEVEKTGYFIPTITEKVIELFQQRFPAEHTITIADLVHRYLPLPQSQQQVEEACQSIEQHPQAVIIVSQYFTTTWIETFRALREQGRKVIWLGGLSQNLGYSIISVDQVPADVSHLLTFPQLLQVLQQVKLSDQRLLINIESYIHPQWNMRRAAYCYLSGAALSAVIAQWQPRAVQVQMLYDPIKGGLDEVEWDAVTARAYRQMMQRCQGVIYSSSVEEMGAFVENALIPEVPRLHLYRFGHASPALEQERYEDGFHLAALSMLFSEFNEPSRAPLAQVARQVLEQGIYLHYYAGMSPATRAFIDTLPDSIKPFLIVHEPIRDPAALVESIRRCHGGFALSYHQMFYKISTQCTDLFMQEAFKMFATTSVATSSLVYAAAGLPVLASRDFWGYQRLYQGSLYQMEFSEVGRLAAIMSSPQWQQLCDQAWQQRHRYDIRQHVGRLQDFLAQLQAPAISGAG
ncbi:hypothetical protein [Balneatrix alpica]|uniref:Glycosyltransferase n=1 Tax=Balneatrix alpica TaxID=75684 RepID=A0ABV5ZEA0_9GAMM|nr:hypothetical protein [Balneatrix alpica]